VALNTINQTKPLIMISFLMDFFPLQNNDQKSFYAVFDGHAGMEAASYAAAHVPYHFVKSESFPRDPPGALKTAFKSTDENFIVKATREVPYLAVYYTHIYIHVYCKTFGSEYYFTLLGAYYTLSNLYKECGSVS
jgi:hypothetical protein